MEVVSMEAEKKRLTIICNLNLSALENETGYVG